MQSVASLPPPLRFNPNRRVPRSTSTWAIAVERVYAGEYANGLGGSCYGACFVVEYPYLDETCHLPPNLNACLCQLIKGLPPRAFPAGESPPPQ